ncbi:MAG TPA: methyltransferase [Sunxiuqinia sp.]|nr:methyltransferase [Sunxiuqinia sp.]
MGRNNYFQFKKFRVVQENSAMKVGIDGVLLGAWANLAEASSILDIGTGTGLLALMAAQRSDAEIEAVELEPDAAAEAQFNVDESPWSSHLSVHVCAIQDFETTKRYDHIISNPPFFENGSTSVDLKRKQARHVVALTMQELLVKSKSLLNTHGKISLILPAEKEERLLILASQLNLIPVRLCRVAPDETKKAHRILVELSDELKPVESTQLTIRDGASGEFSMEYRDLTSDFYLNL